MINVFLGCDNCLPLTIKFPVSMKKVILLLLIGSFWACQPDSKADKSQEESAEKIQNEQPTATTAANNSSNQPANKAQGAATATNNEKVEVGTREANQPAVSDDVLLIEAGSTAIKAGEMGCVDIKVRQFSNLLSMQYTIAWDAKVLKFNTVKNFGLPYINQQNFGGNRLLEGRLPFVWIDNQLQGTTIPDESTVFTLCFDALGKAGEESAIRFIEQPTPFEVVNIREEVQQLKATAGKVTIE